MGEIPGSAMDVMRDVYMTPSQRRAWEEIRAQHAIGLALTNMLVLCGEREARDIEGYPDKLRALIDGLIDQRRRADDLQSQLAAQRERDGRDAERLDFIEQHGMYIALDMRKFPDNIGAARGSIDEAIAAIKDRRP